MQYIWETLPLINCLLDKNVVAIAHALATKKETYVAYSHVLQAVKTSDSFIREFNGASIVESLYH